MSAPWISLEHLLLTPDAQRQVAIAPALDHAELCQRALCLAAHLRARKVQRLALYLPDTAELAIALFAAWQADIQVLLPGDDQPHTRLLKATPTAQIYTLPQHDAPPIFLR